MTHKTKLNQQFDVTTRELHFYYLKWLQNNNIGIPVNKLSERCGSFINKSLKYWHSVLIKSHTPWKTSRCGAQRLRHWCNKLCFRNYHQQCDYQEYHVSMGGHVCLWLSLKWFTYFPRSCRRIFARTCVQKILHVPLLLAACLPTLMKPDLSGFVSFIKQHTSCQTLINILRNTLQGMKYVLHYIYVLFIYVSCKMFGDFFSIVIIFCSRTMLV